MKKFGIIGFGKMGRAIASGVKEALFAADEMIAFDKNELALSLIKEQNIVAAKSVQEVFDASETVLISVKPQDLAQTLSGIKCNNNLVLSIAAGVSLSKLKKLLPQAKIARAMPNTCASIKMATSTVCFDENCTSGDKNTVKKILSTIGSEDEIDEVFMDDVVPISGSFTAYSYYFFKQFALSAAARGLDEKLCYRLILNTVIGSANMVLQSDKGIDELIKDVCSKGGTTLAGLDKLSVEGFDNAVKNCVDACAERSKELGKQS